MYRFKKRVRAREALMLAFNAGIEGFIEFIDAR
jgi:hypothetical protein